MAFPMYEVPYQWCRVGEDDCLVISWCDAARRACGRGVQPGSPRGEGGEQELQLDGKRISVKWDMVLDNICSAGLASMDFGPAHRVPMLDGT